MSRSRLPLWIATLPLLITACMGVALSAAPASAYTPLVTAAPGASCQDTTVEIHLESTYHPAAADFLVDSARIDGLAASCQGADLVVILAGENGETSSSPIMIGSVAEAVRFGTPPAARDVVAIRATVAGLDVPSDGDVPSDEDDGSTGNRHRSDSGSLPYTGFTLGLAGIGLAALITGSSLLGATRRTNREEPA